MNVWLHIRSIVTALNNFQLDAWPASRRFCVALGLALSLLAAVNSRAQTVLVSEGFEGVFPGAWSRGDSNAANGSVTWKDVDSAFGSVPAHTGGWKGYCAGISNGVPTTTALYANNMQAYLDRTINFSGFSGANLSFWYDIPSIETNYDHFRVYMDSTRLFDTDVGTKGWQLLSLPLNAYLGGSHTLRFEFDSDYSVTYEGAYLDDIRVDGANQPVMASLLSVANANYTGYVLASDTFFGRSNIQAQAVFNVENFTGTSLLYTNVLSFRLLNAANGQPHPIYDLGNTVTNAGYTYNITNVLSLAAGTNVTVTNTAYIRPAASMSQFTAFDFECRMLTNGAVARTLTTAPMNYYDFTNTVSGDAALNVLLDLTNSTWSRTYAVKTVPGQDSFQVNVGYEIRRWDDFNSPPAAASIPVVFNYTLRDAAGNVVPLARNDQTFYDLVTNYSRILIFGVPYQSPYLLAASHALDIRPAGQLDSVSQTYYLTVAVSHTNNPVSGQVITANSLSTPIAELLHFDGNLLFGDIGTTMNGLGSPPPPAVPPSGGVIPTAINAVAGYLTGKSDHTFSGAGPLSVNLEPNGDAVVTAGTATLTGPSPDVDSIHNISFQRGNLTLASTGAQGPVLLILPAGFSVGLGPTNRLTLGGLLYPNTPLDANLLPKTNQLVTAGPFSAVEETVPFWFQVGSLTWQINSGELDLPVTGGVFVRQEEDDLLTAHQSDLVDTNAANRISNDGYYRNATAGGSLTVTADTNGAARLTTQINLAPPELRPHFPYSGSAPGQQIPATTGTLAFQDGLIMSNSFLQVSNTVPVSYARDCSDTNCSAMLAGPVTLQFAPDGNQLRFTRDGGLLAYGSVPATDLTWGYVDGTYAQQALNVSDGAFEMAGTFLDGGQTALDPAVGPAVMLLSGFGDASNPNYLERPEDSNYAAGEANYAGLNFRSPATGLSHIAHLDTGPYSLTARSKYYVRAGGVSGIHEAATFPKTTLHLYGYNFTFTTYRLSFLDSEVWQSRTDGAISFPPEPAGFMQDFEDMLFSCRGDLESADVPASSGKKHLAYWDVDFTPECIQFKPSADDPCGTGKRWLVLGVETKLPLISQALHAELGFETNGNLATPADHIAGTDSRFPVPAQLSLQGPGTSHYPLSTAAKGYFNNWATAGAPASGFYNLVGKLRLPFFDDMKVQLHITPTSTNSALVAIMGGWPTPDSTAQDHGWTENGKNYFNTSDFDPASAGWPATKISLLNYESPSGDEYRPRAQRDWIEVAKFDYPLQWYPALRDFSGFGKAPVVLPVINVDSKLKELSPGRVDLDFDQDVSLQLPEIKSLDLLNDAVGEIDGPLQSVSNAVRSALTFDTAGLNELQHSLREDPRSLFEPILDSALSGVVDNLYTQLAGLPQTNRAVFLSEVADAVNSSGLASALSGLNGTASQADRVVGRMNQTLADARQDIGQFNQILGKDSSGNRNLVNGIVKQLVSDQLPAYLSDFSDSAVNSLVKDLNPTLDAIQSRFQDLNNGLAQVQNSLTSGTGYFNQALGEVLNDANASQQFVQAAATDLTNYLAGALTPAGDYFTADPAAAKAAIRQQLDTAFLSTPMAANYQQTLKQFLFDDNAALDELMDTLFDRINNAIRDGLADEITAATDGTFDDLKGVASGTLLAAKIRGTPTFNGDSLRKIHLDAALKMNVPDPMTFHVFMDIKELDSQSVPVDCIPAGAPAAEVTLGADNVKLDWGSLNPSGTPLTMSVDAKWTLQGGSVIGLGGSLDIKGKVGFKGCSVNEIGAALAFGATENYFAAKAAGTVTIVGVPVDVRAGLFAGKACSLDPLLFVDHNADQVLGGHAAEFDGLYVAFDGGVSLSEILFGESDCFIDVEANVSSAVYYNGGPSTQEIGMWQKAGLDLSLLCLLSGNASMTMFGSVDHSSGGYAMDIGGSAQICGSIGPCPFCVSACKGITVTGVVNSGGVDYHVDY